MTTRNSTHLPRALFFLAASLCASVAVADTLPSGDYESGGVTLGLTGDGHYRVSQGEAVAVEGSYTVDASNITFIDEKGPYACTDAKPAGGIYAWKIDQSTLTLKKIADACDERASDLTAHIWQKK